MARELFGYRQVQVRVCLIALLLVRRDGVVYLCLYACCCKVLLELVAQGSQTVTQNGTVDTTAISSVTVNVQGGGGADLASADVYIADYLSTTDLTITLGAVNRYQRYIVGG